MINYIMPGEISFVACTLHYNSVHADELFKIWQQWVPLCILSLSELISVHIKDSWFWDVNPYTI